MVKLCDLHQMVGPSFTWIKHKKLTEHTATLSLNMLVHSSSVLNLDSFDQLPCLGAVQYEEIFLIRYCPVIHITAKSFLVTPE